VVAVASLVFIALLLGFTFFALRATVGRAMRPVRSMSEQASAWSDQDLDRRFDPDSGPLELRRLATTLNELLERISATLRHERNFTAELSHELRTPLAHLHAEISLLDGDARAGDLMTSVRRLETLVESALSPARAGQPAVGLAPVADVLAGLPRPRGTTAHLTVTGARNVTLAVETDIARRALLPVLENAWRYAVDEVRIQVSCVDGTARLAVSDDGGRLSPEDAEQIFTPGFRADPADGYPGAGLGLALTRRIARSTGGDATAEVTGGRTTITLTLPCLPH
jgi:signal transduction histidine kinase